MNLLANKSNARLNLHLRTKKGNFHLEKKEEEKKERKLSPVSSINSG